MIPTLALHPPPKLLQAQAAAQAQTEESHPAQDDTLKAYLLERRRALLSEVAAIERLLGFEKKTVDKR